VRRLKEILMLILMPVLILQNVKGFPYGKAKRWQEKNSEKYQRHIGQ
jgi:hypothetical protein